MIDDDIETRTITLSQLTPVQLDVSQNGIIEPPFKNKYWDQKEEGIYVDVVSGEPLCSHGGPLTTGKLTPRSSIPGRS